MPTYDYVCDACGHTFEKFQSMTARSVRVCPRCGKSKARRLIGAGAGVIFKGSGFYQTDYRSESYRQAAKKDQPSSEAPAGSKDKASGSDGPKDKAGGGSDGSKSDAAASGKTSDS